MEVPSLLALLSSLSQSVIPVTWATATIKCSLFLTILKYNFLESNMKTRTGSQKVVLQQPQRKIKTMGQHSWRVASTNFGVHNTIRKKRKENRGLKKTTCVHREATSMECPSWQHSKTTLDISRKGDVLSRTLAGIIENITNWQRSLGEWHTEGGCVLWESSWRPKGWHSSQS